jgi:hypothetical protein
LWILFGKPPPGDHPVTPSLCPRDEGPGGLQF